MGQGPSTREVADAGEVERLLTDLGHGDWLVEVDDGVVEVTGPEGSAEKALARVAATTVAGVMDVRFG